MHKVQRWAILLTSFNYTITHIDGANNDWADLLSRWGTRILPEYDYNRISTVFKAPLAPHKDPEFSWPSVEVIKAAQTRALSQHEHVPTFLTKDRRQLYRDDKKRYWIPSTETTLQVRLCIIAHCGRGGHRGSDTTLRHIAEHYVWKNMSVDVHTFCNTCLHCLATAPNIRVPRPLANTMHADKPNELIHFDYLYLGESKKGVSYVLIIKDDATSYTWLTPCERADAEHTVDTLLKWFASFGVAQTWISDKGSHFKNTVMILLNKALHAHHHLTTPYNPRSNGTVERVCQEVLRAARSILSEFRLCEEDWPDVIYIIQSILNNSKRPSLNHEAPITAFTGLPADNPLRTMLPSGTEQPSMIDIVKASRITNIEKTALALDEMHKEISASKSRTRQKAIDRHNKNTNICPVNFEVGDFVLVGKIKRKDGHKLRVTWQGPLRVVRVASDLVYEIEDLITSKSYLVHANRLRLYSDRHLEITETLKDSIFHNSGSYNIVEEILELRFNQELRQHQVLIRWKGFDDEQPGWEPLDTIAQDIPDFLEKFLDQHSDKDLVAQARKSLS